MDPLSALILAGILTALLARTAGAAVTDAIAQAKGETPPSLEKWRKRQEDRAARGEAREKEPGPWRRRWRNAVEHRNAKAAQKHAARMELLRDNGRDNVDRHKDKLIQRAARWNKIGATVAGMGNASWDAAKNAAEKAKDRRDENQAWKENERRTADPDQTTDPGSAATPNTDPAAETAPDQGADVLPFRRPDPNAPELTWKDLGYRCSLEKWLSLPVEQRARLLIAAWREGYLPGNDTGDHLEDIDPEAAELARQWGFTSPRPEPYLPIDEEETEEANNPNNITDTTATSDTSNTDEGNPLVTSAHNTATEITDLDTAITYTAETAKYTDTVSAAISDILAQIETAAKGLATEAAQYEQAKANVGQEGFGVKFTGKFDTAAEALNLAAEALKTSRDRVQAAAEQVTAAGGEMRLANKAFSDQLAVSEQVGVAQQDGGVSKRTAFYSGV